MLAVGTAWEARGIVLGVADGGMGRMGLLVPEDRVMGEAGALEVAGAIP